MKLSVVLTFWDGTTKEHIMYSDEVPYKKLRLRMMEGKVSGFSVTKYTPIMEVVEKTK